MKAWVKYSLVRLGVFAITFALLLAVGVIWWLAAVIAAVIGFCVAYIFFRQLRDAMTADIVKLRGSPARRDGDALAEDDADEAIEDSTGPSKSA